MPKAAIIGNTTWGSTLATLLGDKGVAVKIWARSRTEAEELNQGKYSYSATNCIEEALDKTDLVIWAVPSQRLRQNVTLAKSYLTDSMLFVSAAKGLEVDTGDRMSQVIGEVISSDLRGQICVLSGPNLAKEIAQGLPAAAVVASENITVAEKVRELIECPHFTLFTSEDVIGVELGGAFKNIVALGAGVMDGLALGDNAKSAFITYGWTELVSLGTVLGANPATFYGLAGLGDLVTTCAGNLSRNHYVGYELAKSRPLSEIRASMPQVAEGVYTSMAAHQLALKLGKELPIVDIIYDILFQDLPVKEAIVAFKKLAAAHYQPSLSILSEFAPREAPIVVKGKPKS